MYLNQIFLSVSQNSARRQVCWVVENSMSEAGENAVSPQVYMHKLLINWEINV